MGRRGRGGQGCPIAAPCDTMPGPAMSEFEGPADENRADRPRGRRRGIQVLGQWMIIAGILAALVGLVAQLLVAVRATPQQVSADRMPAADFGIVIVGVSAGIVLVLLGELILAVRGRRT